MSYIIQRFTVDMDADVLDIAEPFEASLNVLEEDPGLKVLHYTNPTTVYEPGKEKSEEVTEPTLKNIMPTIAEMFSDLPNVVDREADIEEVRRALAYLVHIKEHYNTLKDHIQADIHERLVESDHKFYVHGDEDIDD